MGNEKTAKQQEIRARLIDGRWNAYDREAYALLQRKRYLEPDPYWRQERDGGERAPLVPTKELIDARSKLFHHLMAIYLNEGY